MRSSVTIVLSCWLVATGSIIATGQQWPQFRGPHGNGISEAMQAPIRWSETDNVTWKTTIPGKGWSSPVVAGKRIWMTTALENEDGPVHLHAVCVDFGSGKIIHNIKLFELESPEKIHAMNSYASPTPVISGERVFCHFGNYGTAALHLESGRLIWKTRRFRYDTQNGPGASPVAWNGLLLFNCDGRDKQFAVAIDQATGATVWKTDRSGKLHDNPDFQKSYCTPAIIPTKEGDILVSPAADWVYAYEPSSGKELWKVNYGQLGFSCVPKPVYRKGTVYVLTSFMKSRLLAIDVEPTGDLNQTRVRWKSDSNMPQKPSLIVVEDNLYAINDKGILTCLDTETGQTRYRERIGGNFAASPIYAAGHLYLFDTRGRTTVFKPGDKFERVSRNQLDGMFMASPAVVGKSLVLRTDKALYRID